MIWDPSKILESCPKERGSEHDVGLLLKKKGVLGMMPDNR